MTRALFITLVAGLIFVGARDAVSQPMTAPLSASRKSIDVERKSDLTAAPGGVRTNEAETARRVEALENELRAQKTELEQLRKQADEHQEIIESLIKRLGVAAISQPAVTASQTASANDSNREQGSPPGPDNQLPTADERLQNVEDRLMRIGPFRFSGDFRLRLDGILRSAGEPPNPPLTHVQNVRARYRLRFNLDTDLYPTLSFHGQLATGPINNPLTFDQDFSSTTVRHPFFISEAWIDYHPKKSVQFQAGRVQEAFADNSRFLFDDDIRFNGFNEKYIWSPKSRPLFLSSVEARAGQYILTNPNVAVIALGSPLDHAAQTVGTASRSTNLFHQGLLFNQRFNKKWTDQFGADLQIFRNPNQIALASTAEGLALLIQPGIGIALSGPLPGTGTATTTPGGAIYSARSFKILRLPYRLEYAGFKRGNHNYPVTLNFQVSRNIGTGLRERDAMLAAIQIGKIVGRGDISFLYAIAIKGANSLISQLTDDDLGTLSGVNIRTNYFRFEYGVAKKVTLQSLFFMQNQLRNSGDFPNFFVPLGAFAPRTYRFQQQLAFSF